MRKGECVVTKVFAVLMVLVLGLSSGCSSGPRSNGSGASAGGTEALRVNVDPRPGAVPVLRAGQAIRLLVPDPVDARTNARRLGHIRATVSDLYGSELWLDRDAAALTGDALRAQLSADGFVMARATQAQDFELALVLRSFELNIAGRDELNLVLEATLREGGGAVVWAGVVSEKTDRFAGVMGNNSASIARYLGQGVEQLVQKLSTSVRQSLLQSYSQSLSTQVQAGAPLAAAGVTTLQPARAREGGASGGPVPAAPPVQVSVTPAGPAPVASARAVEPLPAAAPAVTSAAAEKPAGKAASGASIFSGASSGYGYFSVISMPTRVKVYSDDVYYGLTPLKVMVPAGVMTFEFRFDGYKSVKEKVSVRAGETTELELKLRK